MSDNGPRPTKSAVGRGVAWSAAGSAATQAVNFIAFLIIARSLDPSSFGLVAIAALFVALFTVFVEQGFTHALVQRADLEPEHLDTAFWTNMGFAVLLIGGLNAVAAWVADLFGEAALGSVLRVLSLSLLFGALSGVQIAILQRGMRFGELSLRPLVGALLGGAIGIALAWAGFGVWSLVAQALVSQAITSLGFWLATGWRPKFLYSVDHLQHLLGFGLHILGSNLVNFANSRAPEFFIGLLLGKAPLGIYAVAAKVQASLSQVMIGTIMRVSLATLSRLQDELSTFKRAFYLGIQLTAAVAFPIFVGIAVLSEDIATAVFGSQWIDAAPLIAILSITGLTGTVGTLTVTAINSLGFPKRNYQLDATAAVFTAIVVLLAAQVGIVAVAIALLVRAVIFFPLRFMLLRQIADVRFSELLRVIWGTGVSAAVMATVVHLSSYIDFHLHAGLRLLVLVMVGAVTYGLSMLLFAPKTLALGVAFFAATVRGEEVSS